MKVQVKLSSRVLGKLALQTPPELDHDDHPQIPADVFSIGGESSAAHPSQHYMDMKKSLSVVLPYLLDEKLLHSCLA